MRIERLQDVLERQRALKADAGNVLDEEERDDVRAVAPTSGSASARADQPIKPRRTRVMLQSTLDAYGQPSAQKTTREELTEDTQARSRVPAPPPARFRQRQGIGPKVTPLRQRVVMSVVAT